MRCLLPYLAALAMHTGCSESPGSGGSRPQPTGTRPNADSSVFASYLMQRFGEPWPTAEHWYVVIPAVGCQGCGCAELRFLAQGKYAPNVTLVASGLLNDLTHAEVRQLGRALRLHADTLTVANNLLDRLNLPFSSLTGIVHTQNGQAEYFAFDVDTYKTAFARLPPRR